MPQTYRPTQVIEAVQWTGGNITELREFAEQHGALIDLQVGSKVPAIHSDAPHFQFIGSLNIGDWMAAEHGSYPWSIPARKFSASYEPTS